MDIRTYIHLSAKTALYDFSQTRSRLLDDRIMALLHYSIGLAGETLEWNLATENSTEEIGDMWWYTSGLIRVWSAITHYGNFFARLEAASGDFVMSADTTRVITETAEAIVDAVKGHVFYGKVFDIDQFELLLTMMFVALSRLDATGLAREANIAKLKARYGDKFSEEMAINRDLGDEQQAMEPFHRV